MNSTAKVAQKLVCLLLIARKKLAKM